MIIFPCNITEGSQTLRFKHAQGKFPWEPELKLQIQYIIYLFTMSSTYHIADLILGDGDAVTIREIVPPSEGV